MGLCSFSTQILNKLTLNKEAPVAAVFHQSVYDILSQKFLTVVEMTYFNLCLFNCLFPMPLNSLY